MILKKLSIAAAVAAFIAPTVAMASTDLAGVQQQVSRLQREVQQLKQHNAAVRKYHADSALPVTSTALLAHESAYDGSDLTSNFSTINEDLTLLQVRQKDEAAMLKGGLRHMTSQRPWLQLSGLINADFQFNDPSYFNADIHSSSLDVTAAEFDTSAFISPWVNAFVALKWKSMTGENNVVKANRAFVTLGKLSSSPFYGSFGIMYAPFGRYSTGMISDPLTKSVFRTHADHGAVVVGFNNKNFNVQAYTFHGNTTIGAKKKFDYTLGVNANFLTDFKGGSVAAGAGYISNVADGQGFQTIVYQGKQYNQFSSLNKRVPGYDVNGKATYGDFSLTGEFIGTTTAFDKSNLSFNGKAAEPKVLHLEGAYNFNMLNRPSNVGVAFGNSWQAIALAAPKTSYSAFFNTEIKKDLLFALQYSHNINYKKGTTGSAGTAINATSYGKSQNVYYVQLSAYF